MKEEAEAAVQQAEAVSSLEAQLQEKGEEIVQITAQVGASRVTLSGGAGHLCLNPGQHLLSSIGLKLRSPCCWAWLAGMA